MLHDVKLVLEDGTELLGHGFGASAPVCGEVVFNTAMCGYLETLTDPSYRGQILVMTYPLVGNYGVPPERPSGTLERPYESGEIQVQGLVVQNYMSDYSHHAATRSLSDWMMGQGIPGVTGIDTRALTRRLREHGTMRGWLFDGRWNLARAKREAAGVDMREEVFQLVTPDEVSRFAGGDLDVLLIDVGAKDNIVRSLQARGAGVIRAPWHAALPKLAEEVDGILIANGPGDPRDLGALVADVRGLMGSFPGPIFGICLGNQVLARAAGADTYKLSYGHRSINQPVQDLLTRRSYITSQNHGYAVSEGSLPAGWETWFVNINDGTNEGLHCRSKPFFSVQFHPEASPGPRDTGFLFDDFLRLSGALARR
ncbi:MAG: glutamine-hydrolyzing carbamoyl-phosphate synthase small subunit [Gammaproteobacteria bacterium]|nr:glutamine-hydrolyzing carbamoyl-phosphate synthase small subunit [Gammaproteobacteria bacterium]